MHCSLIAYSVANVSSSFKAPSTDESATFSKVCLILAAFYISSIPWLTIAMFRAVRILFIWVTP